MAENVEFAQKVLEYRQRQREEREKKRQEEQERNAAHKARMQAQYGVEQRNRGERTYTKILLCTSAPPHPCLIHRRPQPPLMKVEVIIGGGMDTDEEFSNSWWERVKYYARLAIERVEYGVDAVKQLLNTLTSDERWGVILEFEDIDSDKFGQLIAIAPDWVEWMG